MAPKSDDFLVEDTEFWVVKPRISGASITGLSRLLSGAYIGMESGSSRKSSRDFVALGIPPVGEGVPRRFFVLKTPSLGSLDTAHRFSFVACRWGKSPPINSTKMGGSSRYEFFVKAPYDQYVNPNTRFWQASGIDVQLSAICSAAWCPHRAGNRYPSAG
jgi:paraquat-inducible protein B